VEKRNNKRQEIRAQVGEGHGKTTMAMAFIGSNVFKYLTDYTLKNSENNTKDAINENGGKSVTMNRKLTEIEAVRIKAVVSCTFLKFLEIFSLVSWLP